MPPPHLLIHPLSFFLPLSFLPQDDCNGKLGFLPSPSFENTGPAEYTHSNKKEICVRMPLTSLRGGQCAVLPCPNYGLRGSLRGSRKQLTGPSALSAGRGSVVLVGRAVHTCCPASTRDSVVNFHEGSGPDHVLHRSLPGDGQDLYLFVVRDEGTL